MSDDELKLKLAAMLPKVIDIHTWDSKVAGATVTNICWRSNQNVIQDTEWLHVCWLIEQSQTGQERYSYRQFLQNESISLSWQQRAEALVAVMAPTQPASSAS